MKPSHGPEIPFRKKESNGEPSSDVYRALLDSMNDAFVITDAANLVTYANQRFCEMIGYPMQEVLEADLRRFLDQQNWDIVEKQNAVRRSGGASQYELEWIHWTGERVPTLVSGSPLIGTDGAFNGSFAVITDITGLRKAEEATQLSEGRYRTLFDEVPVGIVTIGSKGEILSLNRAGTAILGAANTDYTKAINVLTFEPLIESGILADIKRCMGGKVTVAGERPYTSYWGRRSFVRYKMTPRLDADGNVTEILCSFDDMSESRRAEERMRQSQNMLKQVMSTIPELVFWKDRSSVYLGCNTNFAVMAGVGRPESIVGKTDSDLAWTEAQARVLIEKDRQVITSNTPEFRAVEKVEYVDGRITWFETSRVPLCDSAGNVIGVLGTSHDITDRRQDEDEVKKSESRYKALAEHSPQGIAILRKDGFVYVNSAFAEMTARTIEGLLSMNLDEVSEMAHPEDRDTLMARIQTRLSKKPVSPSYEYRFIRPSGEVRWIDSYSSSVEYGGEPAIQTLFIDVTDRRRAEKEVKSAKDRATFYLDLMTHDIRNQMQVILSGADLLRDSTDDDMKTSFFDVISCAVQRCSRMIEEVRATEQLIHVPLSERSLSVSVEKCVDALSGRSEKTTFETRSDVTDARVMADDYLELLITNILANAVEHNPHERKHVWVRLSEENGSYVLTIADDGPGIHDTMKGGLLDKARRFGGLGLHQSSQIAEKYGGRIDIGDRIDGDYSQGAEFRIVIPKSRVSIQN